MQRKGRCSNSLALSGVLAISGAYFIGAGATWLLAYYSPFHSNIFGFVFLIIGLILLIRRSA